ncbi:MAG: hypothetical protein AB2A00_39460, partial [Myxococcota bacterium]
TLITAVRPFALIDWKKWGFNASYSFSVRKNFHQYAHPTVDAREGTYDCPSEGRGRCVVTSAEAGPRLRSTDDQSYLKLPDGRVLDLNRRNTDFIIYHSLVAGYTLFEQLTLSASFIFIDSFKYYLPKDAALSSMYVKNEWGRTQSTWGILDATWSPFERVSFSTGVSSLQPLWSQHRGAGFAGWDTNGRVFGDTSGGKLMPNFPFFDFMTPGNNYTSYYFDITVSI